MLNWCSLATQYILGVQHPMATQFHHPVYHIPANYAFLPTLATWLLQQFTPMDLVEVTVYLPSRRACRELKKTLLGQVEGAALLLPKIKAIGDVDYDDLWLDSLRSTNLEHQSFLAHLAVSNGNTSRLRYKILLIKELMQWSTLVEHLAAASLQTSADYSKQLFTEQLITLAGDLDELFSDLEKGEVSLEEIFDQSEEISDDVPLHRAKLMEFLVGFQQHWQEALKRHNLMSVSAWRDRMINYQAESIRQHVLKKPVILAGVDGAIRAIQNLAQALYHDPKGYVVLRGMDRHLGCNFRDILGGNAEATAKYKAFNWSADMGEMLPQYLLKRLLDALEVTPEQVEDLPCVPKISSGEAREQVMSAALLPSQISEYWQHLPQSLRAGLEGISLLEVEGEFQEYHCLALLLQQYAQQHSRVALVTSNKRTAEIVYNLLLKDGIAANNTLGTSITTLPVLRLMLAILEVVDEDLEITLLLGMLKHPAVSLGYDPVEYRQLLYSLETVLRQSGKAILNLNDLVHYLLQNVHEITLEQRPALIDFTAKIRQTLQGLEKFRFTSFSQGREDKESMFSLEELIQEHLNCLHALVQERDYEQLSGRLEVEQFFQEFLQANDGIIHSLTLDEYYKLLLSLSANVYYKRSSDIPVQSIDIIAPVEGLLVDYDVVILSNMNEGESPKLLAQNPWISKTLYRKHHLLSKDSLIGADAFYFYIYSCYPRVIFTRSRKTAGELTEKSRFLLRLEAVAGNLQTSLASETEVWQRYCRREQDYLARQHISLRPQPLNLGQPLTEMWVTGVEKFVANPYGTYAKEILHLPVKTSSKTANFGNFVHDTLQKFLQSVPAKQWSSLEPDHQLETLLCLGWREFLEFYPQPPENLLDWQVFNQMAHWFIHQNIEGFAQPVVKAEAERQLQCTLNWQSQTLRLRAKVDRLDYFENGEMDIVDYKTGKLPSQKDVYSGSKPQLPLEGLILQQLQPTVKFMEFAYWHPEKKVNGKGEIRKFNRCQELLLAAHNLMQQVMQCLNDPQFRYTYIWHEDRERVEDAYQYLGRVEEWRFIEQ